MMSRLNTGDNLMLFPEGTSSDGQRVLPLPQRPVRRGAVAP